MAATDFAVYDIIYYNAKIYADRDCIILGDNHSKP